MRDSLQGILLNCFLCAACAPGQGPITWQDSGLSVLDASQEGLDSGTLDASPFDSAGNFSEAGEGAGPRDARLPAALDASEPAPPDAGPPRPEDAAELVDFDLPETMDCGARASALVRLRNIGAATWTRVGGYKLGAVDDSDPFFARATRVYLADGDTVETGQAHRFAFELQAPDEAGEYLTDWRMVREGVHWFGSTAQRRIQVVCQAPPPEEPPVPNLNQVVWLHTNVSRWRQSATLSSVRLNEAQICLDYNAANRWRVTDYNGVDVVGNPWIFIWHERRWYAATWEWLRPAQTCKNRHAVAGSHIKRNPFGEHGGWLPSSGHVYYFMVSGLARSRLRNNQERTNLFRFVWP